MRGNLLEGRGSRRPIWCLNKQALPYSLQIGGMEEGMNNVLKVAKSICERWFGTAGIMYDGHCKFVWLGFE